VPWQLVVASLAIMPRAIFQADETLNSRVREWWNKNPFQYFAMGEEGSWEYFRNVDRKFLKWTPFMQTGYPFLNKYVDMHGLKGKKVLDIACGTGVLTEQFARMGADVTGLDLTPKAVELTKKRFALYGLQGNIVEGDAQQLPFPDNTFDFVCAWGCLMHMPKTEQAIAEIHRVLEPGGRMFAMMYHKNSVHLRYAIQLYHGILRMQLLKYDQQSLFNRFSDGVDVGGNQLTKFYTINEFKILFSPFVEIRIDIDDTPTVPEVLPHPWLPLGKLLPRRAKRWICKHWGLSALISARKAG